MRAPDSYFIQQDAARRAVEIALPMMQKGVSEKVVGESGFLYIVIMRPGVTPAMASFEEAILYEHAIGDASKWDADYRGFALAKARVSWKTRLDSHQVQELKPHLLETGDTTLWGSIVLDDIVVAVSGADPWYDEAFAGSIAYCLRAQAKQGIANIRGKKLFLDAP